MIATLKKEGLFWPLSALLLVTFLKQIIWIAVVPIWHTPDEAAHFSTIQKDAEKIDVKNSPRGYGASKELVITEQFLEAERGDDGLTAFTFRPYYKIDYSRGRDGIHESEIKSIPKEFRKESVYHEQAFYPPLYYWVGKNIYLLAYNSDIIFRAFAIRLFSTLTILGIVVISFFLAREIFPKEKRLQIALPLFVSFQPMLTFVSSGINSDNLLNFAFSLFLLISVYTITRGTQFKLVSFLGIIVGLGFLIKPQFIIALFLSCGLLVFDLARTRKLSKFVINAFSFSLFAFLSGGFIPVTEAISNYKASGNPLPYVEMPLVAQKTTELSFFEHLKNSLRQTIAQTLPWYWGVFKWLSLTLPRYVNQIIMRIMLLSVVGLLLKLIFDLKKRDFSKANQALLFLAMSALVFYLVIVWRDWQHIRANGFSLGIQGRYFFPVILAHMSLLFVGLLTWIPEKFKRVGVIVISLAMIILNYVALFVILDSSYNLHSLSLLVSELSQYKPFYLKGEILIFLIGSYLVSTLLLLSLFFKLCLENSKKKS